MSMYPATWRAFNIPLRSLIRPSPLPEGCVWRVRYGGRGRNHQGKSDQDASTDEVQGKPR